MKKRFLIIIIILFIIFALFITIKSIIFNDKPINNIVINDNTINYIIDNRLINSKLTSDSISFNDGIYYLLLELSPIDSHIYEIEFNIDVYNDNELIENKTIVINSFDNMNNIKLDSDLKKYNNLVIIINEGVVRGNYNNNILVESG